LTTQSPLQEALDVCLDSLCSTTYAQGLEGSNEQQRHQLQRVCTVMVGLAEQTLQGIGMPTRVTAIRSLLHIVNTFVSDYYVQYVLKLHHPSAGGATDMPDTLQRCFRLILCSLLPPSPGTLASPLLKRELLLALGTVAKHLEGVTFLLPELTKILNMYQPTLAPIDFQRRSSAKQTASKDSKAGSVSGADSASGSSSNIPIVASASFNLGASTSMAELSAGSGGASQDSDTVIAIAEVIQHVLQKAGDNSLHDLDSSVDTDDEEAVTDVEYKSIQQRSQDMTAHISPKVFWKRLLACAYIGSFEQV
jgi:hypothetical protein